MEELRNDTARVIDALRAGERITLTVRGSRAPTSQARRRDVGRPVMSGLLDTSVSIARETDRALRELPDRVAVSVMTIGELELGVLAALDEDVLARRADTLALARHVATAVVHGLPVVTSTASKRIAAAHPALRVHKV